MTKRTWLEPLQGRPGDFRPCAGKNYASVLSAASADLRRGLREPASSSAACSNFGVAAISMRRVADEILDLGGDTLEEISGGDRSESLAGLSGLELQVQAELVDLRGDRFGLVKFTGFTLGALGFQVVDLAEGGRGDLEGLASGNQEIAGVAGADLDDIGFGSQGGNGFGEDDFGSGHKENPGWCDAGGEKLSGNDGVSRRDGNPPTLLATIPLYATQVFCLSDFVRCQSVGHGIPCFSGICVTRGGG